jgi:polyisoprenoid-binding protein YceI
MKRSSLVILAAVGLVMLPLSVMAGTFALDRAHSSVEFKVRHMTISSVRGSFDDFTASFTYEPGKPETWQAEALIEAASINTGNNDRDNHLRSDDFLSVGDFPKITFKSTGVKIPEEQPAKLLGDLTIRGITKPVVLDLEIHGMIDDPYGNTRAGFTATGKINRQDFGLTWSKVLETGGLVVGDRVDITIEIEGILQK